MDRDIERRVLDSSLAYDLAYQEEEGRGVALATGVPKEILSDVINAHGQRFSVGEAFVACRPFANMVQAIADSEYIPDENKARAITDIIRKSSAQAGDQEKIPEAVTARVQKIESSNAQKKTSSLTH